MVSAPVESVFVAWRNSRSECVGAVRFFTAAIVKKRFGISPNCLHTSSNRAPWGGMARSETTRYVCAMRTAAIMVLAITTSWANDMNCKSSS